MFWGWFVGVALATGLWMVPQGVQAAYSGVGVFTQITSRANMTDGYYVLVSRSATKMAMTATNSGSVFSNVSITVTGGTITDPSTNLVWSIQTNSTYGGHTIYSESSNRYVTYAGSANAAYASAAVSGSTGTWTFTFIAASNTFGVTNMADTTRGLQYNNSTPRFACYTSAQIKFDLFRLMASAPSVTTVAASATNTTTATVNGDVTADGGATVTERGVCYKTTAGVTITDNKTAALAGGTGAFSVDLSSLAVNQIYYFAAYAENSAGTTLSTTELNFTTRANVPSAPTVNNATVSTLDIAVNENGNPASTEFAIQRTSDSQYLQTDGSWGASAVWATKDTWGTKTATGLSSGTEYTFHVKARNSVNEETDFGATASGTTSDAIIFHAKVPGWADHNPGNPAIWGPNPGPGWSGYTMTWDGSWWVVTVPVADSSAAVTYQLRFSQTGTWKYQKASGSVPPSGDETHTTTSGHIWIDSTSPDNWSGDNFSLVASKTTLVVLSLLSARNESGQVVIRWETSSEENTVGFFVERWDGSAWVRVNDQIVNADGQDGMGASYTLVDAGAQVDEVYSYRLVEVETDGNEEVYGPYDLSTGFAFRNPVEFSANGAATLHWLSRSGETYTVLRSTDLTKGREGFQVLRSGIAATPPENTYIDDDAVSLGMYRITVDGE